jgi:hypothetical protein
VLEEEKEEEEERGCILNVGCQEGHAGGREVVII